MIERQALRLRFVIILDEAVAQNHAKGLKIMTKRDGHSSDSTALLGKVDFKN